MRGSAPRPEQLMAAPAVAAAHATRLPTLSDLPPVVPYHDPLWEFVFYRRGYPDPGALGPVNRFADLLTAFELDALDRAIHDVAEPDLRRIHRIDVALSEPFNTTLRVVLQLEDHQRSVSDSLGRTHYWTLMAFVTRAVGAWLADWRFGTPEANRRAILDGLRPGTDRIQARRALNWVLVEMLRRDAVRPRDLGVDESGAETPDLRRAVEDLYEYFDLGPYARLRFPQPERGAGISDRSSEAVRRAFGEFDALFDEKDAEDHYPRADRWLRKELAAYAHAQAGRPAGRPRELGLLDSVKVASILRVYRRLPQNRRQQLLFHDVKGLWELVDREANSGLPKGDHRRVGRRVFYGWSRRERGAISGSVGWQERIPSSGTRNQKGALAPK